MSSFWRFTLLGLFGAAGVVLCLGVVLSSDSPANSVDSKPAADASAVVERANPTIAQQSSFAGAPQATASSALAHAPSSLLAQASHSGVPNPSQPTQAELFDQLRQQLQRAMENPQVQTAIQGMEVRDSNANSTTNRAAQPLGDRDNAPPPSQPPAPGDSTLGNGQAAPAKPKPRITRIAGEGDNNLSIHIQDADLRDVLELLSEQGGLNILPSPSVQGKVSAALNGVDIDTALNAILRSTGFVARHDGRFIYVGTPQDFKTMEQSLDTIGTRIYQLNYVRALDVQALITPLLTPVIGTSSVTAPTGEGIAADDSKAGGNQFAGGDSILVHDFLGVLEQIDQVVAEVDRKPLQVAIEAMILQVALKDEFNFGVDFAFLRDNPNVRLATGTPLSNINNLDVTKGGLKFAFLDSSTGAFISALETIGDTNVIASPQLMVINKARAEILIGEQLGYVNTTITETSTAQNVQFLEVGAQLRLRPFISSDGLIRMEVHPELSTGEVKVVEGFTLPNKRLTQVTTNIMVPDGCTMIIGGLMREDLLTNTTQVPLLGSMPGIGFLFRNKKETTEKREIIVLITPHIICEPDACCEGDRAAAEFHRRQAVYADQMSPIGKRYLGRRYYRLAQAAWARRDQEAALRFIDLAIHFDPENRAAIDLRVDIWNGNLTGAHTLLHPTLTPVPESMLPGVEVLPGETPMIGPPPLQNVQPQPLEGMPPTTPPATLPTTQATRLIPTAAGCAPAARVATTSVIVPTGGRVPEAALPPLTVVPAVLPAPPTVDMPSLGSPSPTMNPAPATSLLPATISPPPVVDVPATMNTKPIASPTPIVNLSPNTNSPPPNIKTPQLERMSLAPAAGQIAAGGQPSQRGPVQQASTAVGTHDNGARPSAPVTTPPKPKANPLDGERLPPWMLEGLAQPTAGALTPIPANQLPILQPARR